MKRIYILRHAEKSIFGGITKQGEEHCTQLQKALPHFSLIISSESPRTIQTAYLLTSKVPQQDYRANIEYDSGAELVELIEETLKRLKPNQYALIISHSPCLEPAYFLLQQKSKERNDDKEKRIADISFAPLTGFIVDEKRSVVVFQ